MSTGVQLGRRWGGAAGVGGWDKEAAAKLLGFPWLFLLLCVWVGYVLGKLGFYWVGFGLGFIWVCILGL